ncbi:MAG: leucyl aminopeptidase [Pseudomonadota bacterium]
MQIQFSKISPLADPDFSAVVMLLNENLTLTPAQSAMDKEYGGIITQVLKIKNAFSGAFGKVKALTVPNINGILHLVLIGLGDTNELESYKFTELGGIIFKQISALKLPDAEIKVDCDVKGHDKAEIAASIAFGLNLRSYRFDKYFTKQKEEDKASPQLFKITLEDATSAERGYSSYTSLIEGIFLARDCINEPANTLYPDSYAEIITRELEACGVKVSVLGEREMHNLGMGAILGVGQGSMRESKLVIMEYRGASDENEAPVAFVGKGVTFDTGGISIKPSANMGEMKYDMAGSATVVGVMKTLALRKAHVNVVGVVGLVENMPGGNAQRPGDVVTTMSGQTIEVLDTDAEGRLVLADALWYTQDKFKPQCIIDLATLTGAIVVALGNSYAGCFSNNDDLADKLIMSGNKVNEKLWRMPLCKDFDQMIKSDIADMANLGNIRGAAGSSTAAQLLQRFVNNVPWVHLDIAGMAWEKKCNPISPRGAVGFGIKLLNQFVKDHHEAN